MGNPAGYVPETLISDGVTTRLPFSYQAYDTATIKLKVIDQTTGEYTDKTVTSVETSYGVIGGFVNIATAATAGDTYVIYDDAPYSQDLNIQATGDLRNDIWVRAIDKLSRQIQIVADNVRRSLKFAIGETTVDGTFEGTAVAGRALVINDTADGIKISDTSIDDIDAALATAEARAAAAAASASASASSATAAQTAQGLAEDARDDAIAAASSVPTLSTFLQAVFPVGAVYISGVSTTPATVLGFGTWAAIEGYVLVGYKSGDADFGTVNATVGAKTVTLDTTMMPPHDHRLGSNANSDDNVGGVGNANTNGLGGPLNSTATASSWYSQDARGHDLMENTGGGLAHPNIQPSKVKYMWERTA